VLATLEAAPERDFTMADRELSLLMSSYWVNFIKTGNPNGPSLAPWSPMKSGRPWLMEFTAKARMIPLLPAAKLKAYRAYVAKGGMLGMF
jgi:para-nitrobenzyl esterase